MIKELYLVWFAALCPSQQLWSCWDGQFTRPHFFTWASLTYKRLTSIGLELAIDPPPPLGGILYTMVF